MAGLRGERVIGYAPEGHRKTMTFIAALRQRGMTAPGVIDGAMNGPMFVGYIDQILAPTLKHDDIVFMDNASVHKVVGVREAIEAAGAHVLYLPAYSPDLNPIEMAFSKLKALGRAHGSWVDPTDRSPDEGVYSQRMQEFLAPCGLWGLIKRDRNPL
jgi:transposase